MLSKNVISMSSIKLLILDGAENAHHDHRYAHLMLDYYHTCVVTERPRFVGLVSPSTKITSEILFVEITCAATFNLSPEKRASLRAQISQPEEIVTFYEPPTFKRDTTLCTQLKAIDPEYKVLKAQFTATAGM